MRLVLLSLLATGLAAAPAAAQSAGGASAPAGSFETGAAGGVRPGAGGAPVARLSAAARGGVPRISVRFAGVSPVEARVVVLRTPGHGVVARITLGRVPAGRAVSVPWRAAALPAGRYQVRVHARDDFDQQLRRPSSAPGKATLVVRGAPAPSAPAPASAPAAPAAPAGPSSRGVFPVRGPVTYGSPFGEDRGSYGHQGQDMAAADGTPVVAPYAGTVVAAAYQAAGAGEYVVIDAVNGRSYVFAHCQKDSVPVRPGARVAAGDLLCRVGSTGRSTGPHLHIEEWLGGWRRDAGSRPIDPMPQLRAWSAA